LRSLLQCFRPVRNSPHRQHDLAHHKGRKSHHHGKENHRSSPRLPCVNVSSKDGDGEGVIEWNGWGDEDADGPEGGNDEVREGQTAPSPTLATRLRRGSTLNSHTNARAHTQLTHKRACTLSTHTQTRMHTYMHDHDKDGIFPPAPRSRMLRHSTRRCGVAYACYTYMYTYNMCVCVCVCVCVCNVYMYIYIMYMNNMHM